MVEVVEVVVVVVAVVVVVVMVVVVVVVVVVRKLQLFLPGWPRDDQCLASAKEGKWEGWMMGGGGSRQRVQTADASEGITKPGVVRVCIHGGIECAHLAGGRGGLF